MMQSSSSLSLALVAAGAAAASALVTLALVQKKRKTWTAEELVAYRRSIFPDSYDPEQTVPKDVLEKMLESANWAPTHGRSEPWRFIIFSTPEAKLRLGEFEAELYKRMCPADKFIQKKYEKKVKSKLASSYVIAICMKRQESERLPELDEICSVACAVQNMHLVATDYGVGAYWSSGGPLFSDEMKEFLGLGEKDKCLGLFYVGVPKGEHPKGARKPMAAKVSWVEK
ncbi:hypothetical protein P43SY_010311 [Pythium insidiosum]|uniref:Nitroreductase domain-containing protein n=1 Tax=Pythium insidiosum TaxID=114742 RepID=A0AAD5Q3J9_PYTIN|nr:hypothetical protein P43SY_010311 [Pythium insidiosum]